MRPGPLRDFAQERQLFVGPDARGLSWIAISAVRRPSFTSGMQMVAVMPMPWNVAASSGGSSRRLSLITSGKPALRF